MSGFKEVTSGNIKLWRNSTSGHVRLTVEDQSILFEEELMYDLFKCLTEYQKVEGDGWLERVNLSPLKVAFNRLEQAELEFEFKVVGNEVKYFVYPKGEGQAKHDWWVQTSTGSYNEKEVIEFINQTLIDFNNMIQAGLDIFG